MTNITIPITLEPDDRLALKQEWLSGKDTGGEYSLDCGAGLGSPLLHVTVDGKRYSADIRDWFGSVIEAIRELDE